MSTTNTVFLPSLEHFCNNPEEYAITFDSVMGWMLVLVSNNSSQMITEQTAHDCIQHIRDIDPNNPLLNR